MCSGLADSLRHKAQFYRKAHRFVSQHALHVNAELRIAISSTKCWRRSCSSGFSLTAMAVGFSHICACAAYTSSRPQNGCPFHCPDITLNMAKEGKAGADTFSVTL
ncbi:hypothetical protein AAFF_G00356690 [Aldrovandia affinis]|uniref:Uncharacterized protein n=1 Tax=Aldrovandia affinis TaxID=143900 RepID=A0AAD7X0C6_9TELE|nr:hypothetical protein AAFF_G00356690 [Aldrovandia affinis]